MLRARRAHELRRLRVESICGTDVYTPIVGHAERLHAGVVARCRKGHAIAPQHLQVELQLRELRHVVLKQHGERVALLLRRGYPAQIGAVNQPLLRAHHRETNPTIRPGHQLAVEFQVQPCCVTLRVVLARVAHPHIVHRVTLHAVDILVVRLCGELKRSSPCAEIVVAAKHHVHRPLRSEVARERDTRNTVSVRQRVAQLLVKRRLVVESRRQSETEIALPARDIHEARPRTG